MLISAYSKAIKLYAYKRLTSSFKSAFESFIKYALLKRNIFSIISLKSAVIVKLSLISDKKRLLSTFSLIKIENSAYLNRLKSDNIKVVYKRAKSFFLRISAF